jgi:hypothetical protein
MVTSRCMSFRWIGGCVVLVGIVGLADPGPRAAVSSNSTAPTATVLNLRLTVSNELPGVSRTALVREADSIWRDAQVTLRWLDGSDTADSGSALRVLVTPRAVSSGTESHRLPVGELLRFEDSSAIAMASITAALRIVQGDPELRLIDLPAMRQYTLGIVLGRAVAHEIGHYLLQSNTHSPYGLMRASIDAREFADLRTGAFRLDRESQASLAARVRND